MTPPSGILETLTAAGHKAYWVGGCVRDQLLGLEPKDWDCATAARPEQILALFPHAKPISSSQAYPVVQVGDVQVATFRGDQVGAHRTDLASIKVGATMEEDAARRDLTINALYQDLEGNILDPTGQGLEDLRRGLIRFVGDPRTRLAEDPIRALRALRFHARIGHGFDGASYDAIEQVGPLLPERVLPELTAMLVHPTRTRALEHLGLTGILGRLLPEVEALVDCNHDSPHHQEGNVFDHTLLVLDALEGEVSPALAWAALLHDVGKPATKRGGAFHGHEDVGARMVRDRIGPRLRWSNKLTDDVSWLVEHHMTAHHFHEMRRGKRLRFASHPLIEDLLALQKADSLGRIPAKHDPRPAEAIRAIPVVERGRTLADVGIDGRMLMERFGLEPGPAVGKLKRALEELMGEHPDLTGEGILDLYRGPEDFSDLTMLIDQI